MIRSSFWPKPDSAHTYTYFFPPPSFMDLSAAVLEKSKEINKIIQYMMEKKKYRLWKRITETSSRTFPFKTHDRFNFDCWFAQSIPCDWSKYIGDKYENNDLFHWSWKVGGLRKAKVEALWKFLQLSSLAKENEATGSQQLPTGWVLAGPQSPSFRPRDVVNPNSYNEYNS